MTKTELLNKEKEFEEALETAISEKTNKEKELEYELKIVKGGKTT